LRAFSIIKGADDLLANNYDVFFFDLDGVVYVGDELLPGSKETISRLQQLDKQVYFLTNDPRFHRQEVWAKLSKLGIAAWPENCITSGWAAACYLAEQGLRSVYVIGTASLKQEIHDSGITIVDHDCCQAVVVGYDDNATFQLIQQAVRCIERGALFIATNSDPSFPTQAGRCVATGAIVAAVQAASGVRPLIVGKPHPYLFRLAFKNIPAKAKVLMIGDSPTTDILGAHLLGLDAVLINPKPATLPPQANYLTPDAVIPDLPALFIPGITLQPWRKPDYPWPDSVYPGVAAVVFNEQGQVLLGKRKDNNLWALPSDHVEAGETVSEAIIRELQEETGLHTVIEKLVGVYSDPLSQIFSYPTGKITHFITTCFRCRVTGGNISAAEAEVLELKFFNLDSLPATLLPMHPQWLADALSDQPASFVR